VHPCSLPTQRDAWDTHRVLLSEEAEHKEEKSDEPDEFTPYYAYPPEYDYYGDYYEDGDEEDEDE